MLFAGCTTIVHQDGSHRNSAAGEATVEMITLEYASASKVCNALEALLGDPTTPPVAADPRTNSIIVLGSPDEIDRVKKVIALMDKEVSP